LRDVEQIIAFLWGSDCIRTVPDEDVLGGGACARPWAGSWRICVAASLQGSARMAALAWAYAKILLRNEPHATDEDAQQIVASVLSPRRARRLRLVRRTAAA
jgi:hypothetical protein